MTPHSLPRQYLVLTLAVAPSLSVQAQTPQEFVALRLQVQRLMEEVDALKKANAAATASPELATLQARRFFKNSVRDADRFAAS